MSDFQNSKSADGLTVKLWRGERTALIGMDVDEPEDDLVGFAIEVIEPGTKSFAPLLNRLNFSYSQPASKAVDGFKNFPSTQAPFQKFRWVHFPPAAKGGTYTYRVTKMHMPTDNKVVAGTAITLDIALDPVIYQNFLDVGFTRNFASSQAYADKYKNNPNIIPGGGADPLKFQKVAGDVYQWLGFEAYELIFGILDEVVKDKTLSLDFFGYDVNEPDIVSRLQKMGGRLRAIIDDSGEHKPATSPESQVANLLMGTTDGNVKRMHFSGLQHNKVLIVKKNGKPLKVLFGSTNFSFRGIYIQANNALVLYAPEAAQFFANYFELAFNGQRGFTKDPMFSKWNLVPVQSKPPVHLCFSPHSDPNLSLNPVAAAIDQASSSVFFAIAFLSQMKSGPTYDAINRLMDKDVFSYGISNRKGGLNVKKPDGSIGLVDFEYLAKTAPEPFKTEWSGMAKGTTATGSKKSAPGITEHNKFVVTDFSLPTAKVFSGSSNLSVSGEKKNGDNLVMIEDSRVATSYAIEAIRIFDHLHFRSLMQTSRNQTKSEQVKTLTLQKPEAISGQPTWFAPFYKEGGQLAKDRILFAH
ncbi:MAG TPA: phospholipase D-like domain-containing protein [Chthoniobacter sp.]|jgi:phosphatidylserine/phosphatidylglycerophosphate/cardiolipin synthase-like enzyme